MRDTWLLAIFKTGNRGMEREMERRTENGDWRTGIGERGSGNGTGNGTWNGAGNETLVNKKFKTHFKTRIYHNSDKPKVEQNIA